MFAQYSNAPAKLLKAVDEFSGFKLKNRVDLQIILEETLTTENEQLLGEIVFSAKYVSGLMRVLKEAGSNAEVKNLDSIQKDLSDNTTKVIDLLRKSLANANGSVKQHFEKTFFEMSQQSFANLFMLLHDLEWTKKFINDQKRNK